MANNAKTRVASRNAALDAAFPAALNNGVLRIYDSTQPTDADTALGGQTLLADLALNATAFAAASAGAKAANAITQDSSADATGTASWHTIATTAGATRYLDGTVGTSASDLNVNTTAIAAGATVSCSSYSISQAA